MPPPEPALFRDRFAARFDTISPAERAVAQFFLNNREDVLVSSAAAIARQTGTSDATVVRTAKALGFQGLEEMRRALAQEIRQGISPAARMASTIAEAGTDMAAAFQTTLDINQAALADLRAGISPEQFQAAVRTLAGARRVFVFGVGPSGAMADYLARGLGRLGLEAVSLTQTGSLLADGLRRFGRGDVLMLFAYGEVSGEVTVALEQAALHRMQTILVSDSLGPQLQHRVDTILPVARGRVNGMSMHTATLALIEAFIVGVATCQPRESLANLEELNRLRLALRKP